MATCDLEPHNVLQCDGDPDNDVAGKTDSRSITPANASTSATASRSASASASVSASDSMDEDIDEEEEDADDDEEDETELKWTALQGAKSLICENDGELVTLLGTLPQDAVQRTLEALELAAKRRGESLGTLCVRASAHALLDYLLSSEPQRVLALDASHATRAADHTGAYAIHVAVREKRLPTLRALLAADVRVATLREANERGFTALHCAVELKGLAPLMTLLAHAASFDVNVRDTQGDTPLIAAARVGAYEHALQLLRAPGCEVDARGPRGLTALMIASARQDVPLMRALLVAGASARATDAEGETALHHAARVQAQRLVFNYNLPETEETLAALLTLVLHSPDLDLTQRDAHGDAATDLVLASLADVLDVARAHRAALCAAQPPLDALELFTLSASALAQRCPALGTVEATGLTALVERFLTEANSRSAGSGDGPCTLIDTKAVPRTRKFRAQWSAETHAPPSSEHKKLERCPLGFVGENPHKPKEHAASPQAVPAPSQTHAPVPVSNASAAPVSTGTASQPAASHFVLPNWLALLPLLPLVVVALALWFAHT